MNFGIHLVEIKYVKENIIWERWERVRCHMSCILFPMLMSLRTLRKQRTLITKLNLLNRSFLRKESLSNFEDQLGENMGNGNLVLSM